MPYDAIADALGLHALRDKRKAELEERAAMGRDPQAPALLKLLTGQMNEDPDTGLAAHADVGQIHDAQQKGKLYNLDETKQVRDDTNRTAMERLLEPERVKGEYALARQRVASEGPVDAARGKGDNVIVQTLDAKTGKPMWTKRSEAAGKFGTGTGAERAEIASRNNTLDQIDEVIRRGDSNKWGGIGVTGPARNWLYNKTGIGSSADDGLRVAMQKMNADVMFGSGGKNLTPTERDIAAGYLGSIGSNPEAAKSKLMDLKALLRRALTRAQGADPNANAQQMQGDEGDDLGPDWGNR